MSMFDHVIYKECGSLELSIRIQYECIDFEIEIQSAIIKLAQSDKLDKIYVDDCFMDQLQREHKEDLIANAAEQIEEMKQEEIDRHEAYLEDYADRKRDDALTGDLA